MEISFLLPVESVISKLPEGSCKLRRPPPLGKGTLWDQGGEAKG